jgi:MOSC domain-containing protein YiiM
MSGVLHSINVSDGGVPKLRRDASDVRERMVPGARVEVREVLLELTAYAAPCTNLLGCFRDGEFKRVSQKVHPGWSRLYARVLREGEIKLGDVVRVQ